MATFSKLKPGQILHDYHRHKLGKVEKTPPDLTAGEFNRGE